MVWAAITDSFVSDALGNSETIYFSILVYSGISIENYPCLTPSATSPSNTVELSMHIYTANNKRRLQRWWRLNTTDVI